MRTLIKQIDSINSSLPLGKGAEVRLLLLPLLLLSCSCSGKSQEAIMRPDAIIACIHWGIEYESLPSNEQKALADWLVSQGVNHVIDCHPHVVQPLELCL